MDTTLCDWCDTTAIMAAIYPVCGASWSDHACAGHAAEYLDTWTGAVFVSVAA